MWSRIISSQRRLFIGKFISPTLLLGQPGLEIDLDPFRERDQFVILVHGKAHQGNQVGQDRRPPAALTLDFPRRHRPARVGTPVHK